MADVALIAAAGWNGAGCMQATVPLTGEISLPLVGCPECMLPLGDGTTPISRVAPQLRALGFEIFVSVGQPGCLFPTTVLHYGIHRPMITREAVKFGLTVSPWTDERVEYMARYGTVVKRPNPDIGSCHSSLCALIDAAGRDWDRWLLIQGDTVFKEALLEEIVSYPCSRWFKLADLALWLNRGGVETYRRIAGIHSRTTSYDDGMRAKVWYTKSDGLKEFAKGGIRLVAREELKHGGEQHEIDHPEMYVRALKWMKKYG